MLDSVTPREGGIADFRFHAIDGNVVVLHREVINSVVPRAPLDTSVDVEAGRQKVSAVFTDRWVCDGTRGRLTIRAFLIDANHYHSNMVDYSVDCGG